MPSDRTIERRERVLDLLAKPDMTIAKRLVQERFFGAVPKNADDRVRHLDNARRTIAKDREYFRDKWKKEKRELNPDNVRMETEEYVARLRSRLNDVDEILEDDLAKSTARVGAIDTAVKIETAIAKARGIDQGQQPEAEGSGSAGVPFFGVMVSLEKLTPAAMKKIDEWRKRSDK